MCTSCAIGKLILRPSHVKIKNEPLKFLEHIQGDICGPHTTNVWTVQVLHGSNRCIY
jgi:hypothetical protein